MKYKETKIWAQTEFDNGTGKYSRTHYLTIAELIDLIDEENLKMGYMMNKEKGLTDEG